MDPGLQTLVQDLGRPGLCSMGVSRSGAFDRRSLRQGNALVGNDDTAADSRSWPAGSTCALTSTTSSR